MLPGLDFSEVIIVIVLALLVLGPKDLPLMMRKLGRFMAKLRGMAAEFRSGFDELARQAELDELRKEVDQLRRMGRDGIAGVADEFSRPMQDAREAVMAPLPPAKTPAALPEPSLPEPTRPEPTRPEPTRPEPTQPNLGPLGPNSPGPSSLEAVRPEAPAPLPALIDPEPPSRAAGGAA